jgi:hypothetical protein
MFSWFASVWKSSWSNKVTIVAAAFIILVAAITIPIAIVTRQGDEGFLKYAGQEIKWDRSDFPIMCLLDDSVEPKHLVMWTRAAKEINDRVGERLLSPACQRWLIDKPFPTNPMAGQVTIGIGQPPKIKRDGIEVETPWTAHPGGVTMPFLKSSDNPKIYGVMLWVDPEYGENYAVWLHEMLHALGLGHDRLRDSVMYPKIQIRPGKLSDKDVGVLRDAYTR